MTKRLNHRLGRKFAEALESMDEHFLVHADEVVELANLMDALMIPTVRPDGELRALPALVSDLLEAVELLGLPQTKRLLRLAKGTSGQWLAAQSVFGGTPQGTAPSEQDRRLEETEAIVEDRIQALELDLENLGEEFQDKLAAMDKNHGLAMAELTRDHDLEKRSNRSARMTVSEFVERGVGMAWSDDHLSLLRSRDRSYIDDLEDFTLRRRGSGK